MEGFQNGNTSDAMLLNPQSLPTDGAVVDRRLGQIQLPSA